VALPQWFEDHQKASVLVKPITHNFNTVSEKLEHYNIPTTKLTTQPFPKLKVITKIINLCKTQKAQLYKIFQTKLYVLYIYVLDPVFKNPLTASLVCSPSLSSDSETWVPHPQYLNCKEQSRWLFFFGLCNIFYHHQNPASKNKALEHNSEAKDKTFGLDDNGCTKLRHSLESLRLCVFALRKRKQGKHRRVPE
jgi:hypothetical protein